MARALVRSIGAAVNGDDAGLIPARTAVTDLTFTSTPGGWSLVRAKGIAYSDVNGVWRLRFNIVATANTATSISSTIVGVTFKSGINQACVSQTGSAIATQARAVTNSGTVTVEHASTNINFCVSGDVELESKPSWA